MTSRLAILCYHRLIGEDELESAWPYLERGTAVRIATFAAHMKDLVRCADVITEDSALEVMSGRRHLERPAVWLTFDDGYRDVMAVVPLVTSGTVFFTTCTRERALPADAWYGVLLRATRAQGWVDLGLGPFPYDLSSRDGRARLVNGPERRTYLRAKTTTQMAMLGALAEALRATPGEPSCYLTENELRHLGHMGWTVGSHSETHIPFDDITTNEISREAAASRRTLSALGGAVRSIALPDGAVPPNTAALRDAGFECVLGLGDTLATPGAEVQARYLVPDDPAWVTRVLQPMLNGAPT